MTEWQNCLNNIIFTYLIIYQLHPYHKLTRQLQFVTITTKVEDTTVCAFRSPVIKLKNDIQIISFVLQSVAAMFGRQSPTLVLPCNKTSVNILYNKCSHPFKKLSNKQNIDWAEIVLYRQLLFLTNWKANFIQHKHKRSHTYSGQTSVNY